MLASSCPATGEAMRLEVQSPLVSLIQASDLPRPYCQVDKRAACDGVVSTTWDSAFGVEVM